MSIGINKAFLAGNFEKVFLSEKERYPYRNPKAHNMKFNKKNNSLNNNFKKQKHC